MKRDIVRALTQLLDPAFQGVLWRGVGLALVLVILFGALGFYALDALPHFKNQWLNSAVEILAGVGIVLAAMLLAYPMAALIIGFFLEDIAARVEAKHYAADPPGRNLGLGASLASAARLLGAIVVVNVLVLPLYLVPGLNLVLFILVNGYLISREYFELVGLRHQDAPAVTRLRRQNRLRVFTAGVVVALALAVPVLNLLAPLFGTALMVHVYKDVVANAQAKT